MVFESILTPLRAEMHPWAAGVMGFVYATLALFLSLWIFEDQAGMVMVFLATMAALPLFYHTMRFEEHKDLVITEEKGLLIEHGRAIRFFMYLFLGMTVAWTMWYVFLSGELVTQIFRVQIQTISNLNPHVTGAVAHTQLLSKIFLNNVKVMIFALFFSFIFGSGAIFILTWNASVISAACGNFFKSNLSQFAGSIGLNKVSGYFYVSGLSVLRYAIHGIPEILAYFIAGLAGGILSVAIIRKDFRQNSFERVLLDFSDLVLIAVGVLFAAAILEVYVTPLFFS